MADAVSVFAAIGLARLLETAAVNVVEPAVVAATQPAVLDAAVAQIGAAVRAVNAQETRPPLIVAKQRELFAENFNRQRRAALRQLFRERHGLPVAPEHLAGRRALICAGQPIVLLLGG